MRRLLALLLFAAPLFAQKLAAPPHMTVVKADGTTVASPPLAPRGGTVIVEFRDAPAIVARNGRSSTSKLTIEAHRATVARLRADVQGVAVRREYVQTFNGVSVVANAAAVARIRALPYVKAIHPDLPMRAYAAPAPAENIKQIGADALWAKYGTRGAGIVVAVIDSGIDYNHPALGGGFGPSHRVIGGYDFFNDDADPMDDFGHGTHVAGIVGANGDTVVGVAPEVSFLAYKVLGDEGGGYLSDILAAIERTADPNGDGDTSDHADVVNLSLGGPGGPDDPLCRAVDHATAAGVVFAIAAGNGGAMHDIGSPGNARSAITVGAADSSGGVAQFSSRGPNTQDLAVKPEVLAPGVAIYSTVLGKGFASLSGTSMASPHVAGAAALLRAVHRDWTPEEIKSALVATAKPDLDVMAAGGGTIDANAAAGATLKIDPPLISFGLDSPATGHWKPAARTVHLTNRGTAPLHLDFKSMVSVDFDVKVTVDPAVVDIAPGAAADVSIAIDANNDLLDPLTTPAGYVKLNGAAAAMHLGWAFTHASRLTVTYDRDVAWPLLLLRDGGTTTVGMNFISERASEALLKSGTYDVVVYAADYDEAADRATEGRLIVRANRAVDGDVTVAVSGDEATHTLTLAGRDERGRLLGENEHGYLPLVVIGVPPGGGIRGLVAPALPGVRTLRVSDLGSYSASIAESLFQFGEHHVVIVQHDKIADPITDQTLARGGAELAVSNLRLAIPPGAAPRIVAWLAGVASYVYENPPDHAWFARVAVSPAPPGASASDVFSFAFEVDTNYWEQYTTPALRIVDGQLQSMRVRRPVGDLLSFGSGPVLPGLRLVLPPPVDPGNVTYSAGYLVYELYGQLGEDYLYDRVRANVTVTKEDGSIETTPGLSSQMTVPFPDKRLRRIDTVVPGFMTPEVPRKTTVSLGFDNTRADFVPPTFTTLFLFDAAGHAAVNNLAPHSGGTLEFSVADYPAGTWQPQTALPIRAEATRAAWRIHGTSGPWTPLSAVEVSEEMTNDLAPEWGIYPAGLLFRADLKEATNVDNALVDIKIDAVDVAGNTAELLIEPAFSVSLNGTIRPRPSR